MAELFPLVEKAMPLLGQITLSTSAIDLAADLSKEPDKNTHKSSDDDDSDYGASISIIRKRVKRFSDSDSEEGKGNTPGIQEITHNSSDSDDYTRLLSIRSKNSRIKTVDSDSSESDSQQLFMKENEFTSKKNMEVQSSTREISDSDSEITRKSSMATKNEEQQNRMKNKRNKLKDKFKGLLNSRDKDDKPSKIMNKDDSLNENKSSSSNDDEETSIGKIRQKIKERASALKMSSIIDPDTSEDEKNHSPQQIRRPKKQQRRVKPISPKPQRMSAKQAMENMQKIKSESNRMLREKDVSLPYHRPKALNLKDIMCRQKLAVTADGKALPIKMNEEQLKQYALQLEQRQKEMMELCKSETEEEDETADLEDSSIKTGLSNESFETIAEINYNNFFNTNTEATALDSEVSVAVPMSTNEIIEEPCNNEISKNYNEESKISHEINKSNTDDENAHDKSEELQLVYNDSIEDTNTTNSILNDNTHRKTEVNLNIESEIIESDSASTVTQSIATVMETNEILILNDDTGSNKKKITETDSQFISLHYDTERNDYTAGHTDNNEISKINCTEKELEFDKGDICHKNGDRLKQNKADLKDVAEKSFDEKDHVGNDEFPSDDDDLDMDAINMEDIDSIIENAEIVKDGVIDRKFDSPALIKDTFSLNKKPILMGAPGMVIDLDGGDATAPKKLTGVELLKERFTYFAKLKTPEEFERERERRQKPGTQHIKLKQELENQIAEQRSLEWTKRLEGEKQQQNESDAVKGDSSDAEDDIDKIEAKLDEDDANKQVSSESEEDDIENDVLIEDKPRKKNPLLADEAEESDVDESEQDNNDGDENDNDQDNDADSEESSDDESSESDDVTDLKPKKGRILKAFEDSDDEETAKICDKESELKLDKSDELEVKEKQPTSLIIEKDSEREKPETSVDKDVLSEAVQKPSDADHEFGKSIRISESQDDDLQLAQVPKAFSEDLFTSLESVSNKCIKEKLTNNENCSDDTDLGSQTFSILKSDSTQKNKLMLDSQEKLIVISETQPFDSNLDAIVGMCSGSFSQNYIEFKPPSTQSQMLESQVIGEDLLDMCTGKFYDNQFVSQTDNKDANTSAELSQDSLDVPDVLDTSDVLDAPDALDTHNVLKAPQDAINKVDQNQQGDILKSVLDELNDPAFESNKPMKFFFDGKSQNKENEHNMNNTQLKKRFVIDSDDETNEDSAAYVQKKKKKLKKRKQALQISDDELDEHSEEAGESISETDDVNNEEEERLVEYDSEENEVVLKQPQPKKKRKVADFFEQEAELTSEDEWAGSGDEDEAGLDRMEREAGDDDAFHQGQLQRELGQIHIRDVLDQDKREVRIIQELLFEDGDLGVGGRQRKFRWRDADGDDATGTLPEQLGDTQEEEFESEEQWRKQRHEREMFLRQMKTKDGVEDELNVTVNRTSIIKANLHSRTMSSLLEEVNGKNDANTTEVPEKKTVKDVTSPTKPFSVYQQTYHGSLLTRGRGALERLAALAMPLATAEPSARPTHSNTNFVFAAIAHDDKEPKVNKRKAETNVGTPQLVKKMRTEDKKKQFKSSLLDYMKA